MQRGPWPAPDETLRPGAGNGRRRCHRWPDRRARAAVEEAEQEQVDERPIATGHYAATKAALEALTAVLRREVAPLGISAMAVEPGAFRTNYKRSPAQPRNPIGDYMLDTVPSRSFGSGDCHSPRARSV